MQYTISTNRRIRTRLNERYQNANNQVHTIRTKLPILSSYHNHSRGGVVMKFMKRAGIYKANNVTFDPKTMSAHSYVWWKFVGIVEGKTIFNSFRYSVSTAKHQRKVAQVMSDLGIKIDITMPLPRGIRADQTLSELIIESEEWLCEDYLNDELKKQERYARAKFRKAKAKLTDYLENQCHFRDYDIAEKEKFANPHMQIANKVAVHQVVEPKTLEHDVQNALHSFGHDGFGSIVFYV